MVYRVKPAAQERPMTQGGTASVNFLVACLRSVQTEKLFVYVQGPEMQATAAK